MWRIKKKENVKFLQSMGFIYIFRQNNKRDYSKNDLRLYMGAYTTNIKGKRKTNWYFILSWVFILEV